MGLFETKYCDICHEKISLLGNRKVEDGNVCKNCAAKLSPFMSGRRHTTLEDIKRHLEYREQNKQSVAQFNPSMILGNHTKVYIDQNMGCFAVSGDKDWRSKNPDIIPLNQVSNVHTEVKENKREIYTKDAEGKNVSYNPKQYEYSYEFEVEINVNSQYFDEIKFELSDYSNRPKNTFDANYQNLQMQANQIQQALMSMSGGMGMNQMGMNPMAGGMNQMGMNQMGMNQMGMNQMGGQMGMNNMGMNQMGGQMGMNNMGMNQMGGQMGMNNMGGMNQMGNQMGMNNMGGMNQMGNQMGMNNMNQMGNAMNQMGNMGGGLAGMAGGVLGGIVNAAADGLAGNPMTGAQQGMNNMNQMGGQMGMNQMGGQMGGMNQMGGQMGMNQMGGQMGMNQMGGMNQMQSSAWTCPYCGTQNEGNNCTGCGQARG